MLICLPFCTLCMTVCSIPQVSLNNIQTPLSPCHSTAWLLPNYTSWACICLLTLLSRPISFCVFCFYTFWHNVWCSCCCDKGQSQRMFCPICFWLSHLCCLLRTQTASSHAHQTQHTSWPEHAKYSFGQECCTVWWTRVCAQISSQEWWHWHHSQQDKWARALINSKYLVQNMFQDTTSLHSRQHRICGWVSVCYLIRFFDL